MQKTEPPTPLITPFAIFISFSKIALCSFGSPPFWARRELVEKRRWITDQEFLELLGIGQLLPGANVLNLLVMVGYRFAGWAGAAAAIAGFLGWPFLIVISIAMLHERFGGLPLVQNAITGMGTVAAGLLVASGIKMAMALPRHWNPWLCCVLAFIGIGLLRLPLLWVLAVLGAYAITCAWKGKW